LGLPESFSEQRVLPPAALLIIDEEPEGGWLLIRYSGSGQFAGDTWHENLEEAKRQAHSEFGSVSWKEAQPTPTEVHDFAIAQVAEHSE